MSGGPLTWVGWVRTFRGGRWRWLEVCQDTSEARCWRVLRDYPTAGATERRVLPQGEHPAGRAKAARK